MSLENKVGDITIFNNYKKTEQKHPDYTGTFTYANGDKIYLSLWKRRSADTGTEFISGYASPPYEGPKTSERPTGKPAYSNTANKKTELEKPVKKVQLDDLDF